MHLPDGVFVEPVAVLAGTWAVAAGGIAIGSRRFSRGVPEESAALVGVLGAFVFAAQMVNFPILGLPVSAHLTGTALLTVLLGPSIAIVVTSAVLLVQALLMQDGGVVVYGANVANLAVIPALVSGLVLRAFPERHRRTLPVVALVGAASIVAASLACGVELVVGAGLDPAVVGAGLLATQGLVAIAEGLITAFAFSSIRSLLGSRTPTWPSTEAVGRTARRWWVLGSALLVVGIAAGFASEHPDTLEHFLEREVAAPEESGAPVPPSPFPDYTVGGVESESLSNFLAGAAGTLVTLGVLSILVGVVGGRRRPEADPGDGPTPVGGPRAS